MMNIKPMEVRDGVEVYNICDFMDYVPYDQLDATVTAWVAENDAVWYSACRENFWIGYGVLQAQEAGKTKVVVEDLS